MSAARFAIALLLAVWPPAAALADTVHHAIEVRLAPATGEITLDDTVTVSGRRQITLDFAAWLRIVSLRLGGREIQPGTPAKIALPDTGRHEIGVRLRGRVPAGGRHGAISGADGAYLPGFGGWLPDIGDAPVTHRLTVTVPEPYRAVATGRLISEISTGNMRHATFASERPGEPPSLFAGPYEVTEREADALTLRTYLHDEVAHLAAPYLTAAGRFIARYAAEIGPYPYASFSVVSSPLPVGLGFPSLTYVGRRVLPLPFMRGRSLAHEVLHSWWGNGVAVDYRTGNWAEGLTTYMADYALAADRGEAPARDMRIGWLRDFAALPAKRDIPVRAFRAKRHDASQVVGYNKTAFVFHMLKDEIGASAFAAGIRAFWRERRFTVAGWPELRAAFEKAAGRDLGWFSRQWLDRPGAPRIELGSVTTARDGAGYRLAVAVTQQPPHYRLTLRARIGTAAGEVERRITVEDAMTEASFTLDAPPRAIALDPGFDAFRLLTPAETPPILRDVTLAANATVLIAVRGPAAEAARALAARLMDSPARTMAAAGEKLPAGPLLIVGTEDAVAPLLARAGLGPAPPETAMAGATAAAWTGRRENGFPVLVVSARDAAALRAVARPLPHYGRRSYVVFDGAKAIRRGVWPLGPSPLSRVLSK